MEGWRGGQWCDKDTYVIPPSIKKFKKREKEVTQVIFHSSENLLNNNNNNC